jgi:flavin reductase (DIM6/NTAB) family NADH-FMN oxidoreductase RutF
MMKEARGKQANHNLPLEAFLLDSTLQVLHRYSSSVLSSPFKMKYSSSLLLLLLSLIFTVRCDSLQSTTVVQTVTPPLIDVPTYSMATLNEDGSTNMNILTYATPVSTRPDRVWSLGLFKGTLTEQNFVKTRTCVLQLLTEQHACIVKTFGGSSGRDVNKEQACAEFGLSWQELELQQDEDEEKMLTCDSGMKVLPGCAYYLKLTAVGDFVDAGSHMIAPYCKVEQMWVSDSNDEKKHDYLSTARLRALGIITEQGRVAED